MTHHPYLHHVSPHLPLVLLRHLGLLLLLVPQLRLLLLLSHYSLLLLELLLERLELLLLLLGKVVSRLVLDSLNLVDLSLVEHPVLFLSDHRVLLLDSFFFFSLQAKHLFLLLDFLPYLDPLGVVVRDHLSRLLALLSPCLIVHIG